MKLEYLLFLLFFQNIIFAQNDCTDAIIVCGNSGFQGLTASGIGIDEISSLNSCGSGENNSIWLKLSINTSGTLGFILIPESTDIEEDFDFYVFGPNSSCSNLGNSIRCSTTNPFFAGLPDNLTGMNEFETETSEGPGLDGNSYVKWLTVSAGDSYFLVVDRPAGFSDFSIQWTGTATFNQPPVISTPPLTSIDLFACDDTDGLVDGITKFNLSQNTPIIKGTQTSVSVTYHESQNDATLGINAIATPTNYTNIQNPQTIFARITENGSGCFDTTTFEIKTNTNFTLTTTEFSICDSALDGNDSNGIATFLVSEITATLFENQDISNFSIKYFPSQAEASNDQNEILQSFTNTIPNQQSIFVKVYFDVSCYTIIEVFLEVKPLPTSSNQTLTQCKSLSSSGSSTVFNLNDARPLFQNNNLDYIIYYYLNTSDLQNNITLPYNFTSTSNPQIIIAKIEDYISKCTRNYFLTLQVNTNAPRVISPIEKCVNEEIVNGITNFNLTEANLNLQLGETFAFYHTENEAILKQNVINNITNYSILTPFNDSVYVRIENGINCSSISELRLIVNKKPKIDSELIDDLFVCNNQTNNSVTLKAGTLDGLPSDYHYKWFKENVDLNLFTSQIEINQSGIYAVEVTNAQGCKATKEFQVEASESATIQNIVIDDFNGNSNTVLVNYSGNGDYEFSLDGIHFQESPYFTDISSGEYTIIINDKKGCLPVNTTINILTYPTFFTPNGDGYNDIWKIKNSATKPNSKIELFDRYGKLLGNFDTDTGWNGKFNQRELPADDYWFILTLETGKLVKGHFSLKR
jgi:gliding motility-associated-like protein